MRAGGNDIADLLHAVLLLFSVLVLSPLWRAVLVLVIEKESWLSQQRFSSAVPEQSQSQSHEDEDEDEDEHEHEHEHEHDFSRG